MESEVKRCSKCKLEKPREMFGKNKSKKDGLQTECNPCKATTAVTYCKNHQEHILAYREKNKERILAFRKRHYEANKEEIAANSRRYYETHKKQKAATMKRYHGGWRLANKDKINSYRKEKKLKDPNFKLACSLRGRLHAAIRNGQKVGSAVRDLGCSISDLKKYLEAKFDSRMTWDNWGKFGWHVDHIRPLASFNLEDRQQFLEAVHYTNLQPLWWYDNLSKSDNWRTEC